MLWANLNLQLSLFNDFILITGTATELNTEDFVVIKVRLLSKLRLSDVGHTPTPNFTLNRTIKT